MAFDTALSVWGIGIKKEARETSPRLACSVLLDFQHAKFRSDARLPRCLAEAPVEGMHQGVAAGGKMQGVGEIGTEAIPFEGRFDLFSPLDHHVLSFKQGCEKCREHPTRLLIAGAQYPFGFQ